MPSAHARYRLADSRGHIAQSQTRVGRAGFVPSYEIHGIELAARSSTSASRRRRLITKNNMYSEYILVRRVANLETTCVNFVTHQRRVHSFAPHLESCGIFCERLTLPLPPSYLRLSPQAGEEHDLGSRRRVGRSTRLEILRISVHQVPTKQPQHPIAAE